MTCNSLTIRLHHCCIPTPLWLHSQTGTCLSESCTLHHSMTLFGLPQHPRLVTMVVRKSKKQLTVAISSTEAESISACFAAKKAVFLRNLYAERQRPQKTVLIKCDNTFALRLMGNRIHREKTKHIRIQYHYVRELISFGEVRFEYVETKQMIAASMTKEVGKVKSRFCADNMGVRPWTIGHTRAIIARAQKFRNGVFRSK